ncbi:MAG TPA: hypothetical protein VH642_12920 [Streptosporangiaceae bacterium]
MRDGFHHQSCDRWRWRARWKTRGLRRRELVRGGTVIDEYHLVKLLF